LKKLKQKLVNWLLKDVEIQELVVNKLLIGKNTFTVTGSYIDFSGLTSDPSLVAGRMWFRSDLGKLRYSPDGSTVKDVPAPAELVNVAQGKSISVSIRGSAETPTVTNASYATDGDWGSYALIQGTTNGQYLPTEGDGYNIDVDLGDVYKIAFILVKCMVYRFDQVVFGAGIAYSEDGSSWSGWRGYFEANTGGSETGIGRIYYAGYYREAPVFLGMYVNANARYIRFFAECFCNDVGGVTGRTLNIRVYEIAAYALQA